MVNWFWDCWIKFQKPIENEGLNPQTHFESLR